MVRTKTRAVPVGLAQFRDEGSKSTIPEWHEEAACSGMDLNIFFEHNKRQQAIDACNACPVRKECLEANKDVEYGVFGGMTAIERERQGWIAVRRVPGGKGMDESQAAELEKKILELRRMGWSGTEIAEELAVSKSRISRTVVKYKAYLTDDDLDRNIARKRERDKPQTRVRHERRERAYEMLKAGMLIKPIAEELGVTVHTIYGYRDALIELGQIPDTRQKNRVKPDLEKVHRLRQDGDTWRVVAAKTGHDSSTLYKRYTAWLEAKDARKQDG